MELRTGVSTDQILIQLLTGAWVTQLVAAAAHFGIPDQLAKRQPQSAAELAAVIGGNAGAVRRVMRTLASIGVFTEAAPDQYVLTPVSGRLRSDVQGSMRNLFLAETDEVHRRSWGHLVDAMRSGEPQPKPVFGMPAFEYYGKYVEEGEQFGRAMQDISVMSAQGVLDHYDFSNAKLAVDVGGGNGSFVRAILRKYPRRSGIVFDLPYIESQAVEHIRADQLSDRCRFESGNFFESVSSGGDIYLLRFILHDWTDDECIRLLRSCRTAIANGGRLLIVEMLLPEDNAPGFVQLMDINMLVMTGGRERTESEYRRLLEHSGFKLSRTIPTGSPFFIIECEPS